MSTSNRVLWSFVLTGLASWGYLRVWNGAFTSGRIDHLPVLHLGVWIALNLVLAGGVTWVAARAFGAGPRAYAMAAVVLIAWQAWSAVDDLGASIGTAPAGILGVAAVVVVGFLVYRLGDSDLLGPVLGTVTGVLLAPAIVAAAAAFGGTPPPATGAPVATADGVHVDDVVFIVVDAYARSDVLADLGIDNTRFESTLEDAGFTVVADASSPYSGTQSSVASMLELRHVTEPGIMTRADRRQLDQTLGTGGALFEAFQDAGYSIRVYENAWTFGRCRGQVTCIRTGVMDELDHAVVQQTPLPWIVPGLRINPWVTSALAQADELIDGIAATDAPTLHYAHLIVPHPPFQLDPDCSPYHHTELDGYAFFGPNPGFRVRAYAGQIRCTNTLLTAIVGGFDDDTAAVIVGDHGSEFLRPAAIPARDLPADHLRERFGVLMAARLPDGCGGAGSRTTTIEAAALLTSCITGVPAAPSVPRYVYIESVDDGFAAVDVTERAVTALGS